MVFAAGSKTFACAVEEKQQQQQPSNVQFPMSSVNVMGCRAISWNDKLARMRISLGTAASIFV